MSNAPRAPLLLLLLLPAASAFLAACGGSPTAPGRTPPSGRAAPDLVQLIPPDPAVQYASISS